MSLPHQGRRARLQRPKAADLAGGLAAGPFASEGDISVVPRGSRSPSRPAKRETQLSQWFQYVGISQVGAHKRYAGVVSGYRKGLTAAQAAASAFMLHNETMNIWTHLLGCIFFAHRALSVSDSPPASAAVSQNTSDFASRGGYHQHEAVRWEASVEADLLASRALGGGGARWPLVLYCVTAAMCLGASALYHCFGCAMSRQIYDVFARLDYAGITVLIYGSCFGIIYYSFDCSPTSQLLYLAAASALGIPKMIACCTAWYSQPRKCAPGPSCVTRNSN